MTRKSLRRIMAASNRSLLKVCHVNAQSLEPHFPDIVSVMLGNQVHVMVISESWLKPRCSSNLFRVSRYNLHRVDRLGKRDGGVSLLVHQSIECSIIDLSSQPSSYRKRPEFMLALLRFQSTSILMCVIYNPPKCGFWSEVEEVNFKLQLTS